MRFVLLVIWLLGPCASAIAQTSIALPLGGYYRAGEYMPIHVSAGACQRLTIGGDGVMPIEIEAKGAAIDAVFPLLVVGSPRELTATADDGPTQTIPLQLQLLSERERFIGAIGEARDASQRLFPGMTTLVIPLDSVQPIRGSPLAWEVLDAVVCDGPIPGADKNVYRPLLGSGVAFAVRSTAAPDSTFPWRQDGPWWVLRHDAVGLRSSLSGDVAMLPALGWSPGVPRRMCAIVVAVGVIVSIFMLAATLIRARRAAGIAPMVAAIASISGIAVAANRQSPVRVVDTGVFTTAGTLLQYDLWQYQTTRHGSDTTFPWINSRPMVTSSEQLARQGCSLMCYYNGYGKELKARIEPGEVLVTMAKNVEVRKLLLETDSATDSPTHALVRAGYVRPGVRVVGQSALDRGNEAFWPPVVLEILKPE